MLYELPVMIQQKGHSLTILRLKQKTLPTCQAVRTTPAAMRPQVLAPAAFSAAAAAATGRVGRHVGRSPR